MIVMTSAVSGSEMAKALQNLRIQIRLINSSIRHIEQVEQIRKKRRDLLSEQDILACCIAFARNNRGGDMRNQVRRSNPGG
jgi:hypothetical protein